MKYLLVMQPGEKNSDSDFYMPMGLAYINGAMRDKGFDVDAINLQYVNGDPLEVLKRTIFEKKIDAVLCGGLTVEYAIIKEIFDAARTVNPKIVTIGGGGGYTSEPILFSEMTNVDYAVIGEGEITNCELAFALDHGESTEHILGLVIKKKDGYVYTGERTYIRDMDSISFPSWEGLAMDQYLDSQRVDGWYASEVYFSDNPRMIPMCLARSCPFMCKFCYHPIGRGYRSRSLDNFFEELDLWIEKYKINSVILMDECFSIKPERVWEFCERIKPYKLAWVCQMRVETYSAELVDKMVDAGCIKANFGLESMSQVILNDMNKKTTVGQLQKALEISYDHHGCCIPNILLGAAAENQETLRETVEWYEKNKKFKVAGFAMIGTYPGSGYYEDAVKRGIIIDKKQFIEKACPLINITYMPDKWYRLLIAYSFLKSWELQNKGNVISVQETQDGINADLQCVHCGHINHYKGIQKKKIKNGRLNVRGLVCRECHNANDYVSDEYEDTEHSNLAKWIFDWLVGDKNDTLEYYMKEHRYNRVAIYGIGNRVEDIASLLIEKLQEINIEIVYAIDQRYSQYRNLPMPVISPDDEYKDVDAILVTPVYGFYNIYNMLKEKTNIRIISLEEILA